MIQEGQWPSVQQQRTQYSSRRDPHPLYSPLPKYQSRAQPQCACQRRNPKSPGGGRSSRRRRIRCLATPFCPRPTRCRCELPPRPSANQNRPPNDPPRRSAEPPRTGRTHHGEPGGRLPLASACFCLLCDHTSTTNEGQSIRVKQLTRLLALARCGEEAGALD